jgi:large subunit ribosomal protein L9
MDIILIQDVPQLGYKGDIVSVKPGFARNYLIPQGMAIVANASNVKVIQENQRQAVNKLKKAKDNAVELAANLEETTIEIAAKTGTSGKIFGSITTLQIAQALKDKGFDIDRRKISLPAEIKETGIYQANVDLHREVKGKVNLVIIPESVA